MVNVPKLKMAAAAMLDSGYQAFFELLFNEAAFSSNLVKSGGEMNEQHQF
jgi:hypothetical protein